MSNIADRKLDALKSIIYSYNSYCGGISNAITKKIYALQDKLNKEDFEDLLNASKKHTDDILKILSNTKKVFVKLEDINTNIDVFDKLFEDIE